MVDISIVNGDVLSTPCDLLILKHADGFYGVDKHVAEITNFRTEIPEGNFAFSRRVKLEAREVLYVGVGPLAEFRYEKIKKFASNALKIASSSSGVFRKICSPIHGPGYGLDDYEAFLSLVSGFEDAISKGTVPNELTAIEIVEKNPSRARRLREALRNFQNKPFEENRNNIQSDRPSRKNENFGAQSENKPKLFVAMPFSDAHNDIWEIAIQDACTNSEILCERISEATFTGDIFNEIKNRLTSAAGLIAVLDDANPNVFLELGYAWALNKPTILLSKKAEDLPFDVRGQKCLIYKNISNLRQILTAELTQLKKDEKFYR